MKDRLLSRAARPDLDEPEPLGSPGHRDSDEETEDADHELEILLKTRIAEAIQRIGNNLDRMMTITERMDRKLEEAAR